MKKILFKLLFASDRVFIFENCFLEIEQTAIINSLWRRKYDLSTKEIQGDEELRNRCGELAKELMNVAPLKNIE